MKQWIDLLLPSRYGAVLMILIAVCAMAMLGLPGVLQRSGISEYFSLLKEGEAESTVYANYQEVDERINSSKFAADSSVFVFWSVVGLLAYTGVLALKRVFDAARELVEETGYAKWGKREIWVNAAIKLLIQLTAIALLFAWSIALLRIVLPFAITSMTRAVTLGVVPGIWYGLLVFVVLVVCLHITNVLLRMLFLRTRLFMNHAVLHGGH